MLTQLYPGKGRASLAQVFLFICLWVVSGCATTEKHTEIALDSASSEVNRVDPYEGFNRSMYGFNMGLDKYLFKPVSDGYKFITPDLV
ncbi:MAG: MlaA family lipoprotein, partial [Methylosarcina sp.]